MKLIYTHQNLDITNSLYAVITDVTIKQNNPELELLKQKVFTEVLAYSNKLVNSDVTTNGYRDILKEFNQEALIPAGQNLVKIIRERSKFPTINTAVDSYNIAVAKSFLAIGAHDLDKIKGDIVFDYAKTCEKIPAVNMKNEYLVNKGEYVYRDDEKILAWLDVRDTDLAKITNKTKNIILIVEGTRQTTQVYILKHLKEACDLIIKFCGGKYEIKKVIGDTLLTSGNNLIQSTHKTKEKNENLDDVVTVKLIKNWLKDVTGTDAQVEHPSSNQFGDYTTNIAMILAKELNKSPNDIATDIKTKLENIIDNKVISKIEVVGGYINFYLTKDFLVNEVEKINTGELTKTLKSNRAGKKYLIEHTSPEPTKTLHIGHFRNNFLGISIHNILETLGAEVTLDCIDNDRGMKICKTMWGYLMLAEKSKINALGLQEYNIRLVNYKINDDDISKLSKDFDWKQKLSHWVSNPSDWLIPDDVALSSDKFDNILYSPAHKASELISTGMQEIQEILKLWENEDVQIRKLWRQIIDWSTLGYERTYKRIGSFHDKVWHESEFYKIGKNWVEQGLKKGIFKKLPDGGVLTNLESYNLPDTIVMKRDDTSMYMTQDFQLTHLKVNTFPSDLYIWDIGNDQQLYLQQMFTVCDQLGIISKDKLFHLNYGFITLKGGARMGSRFGGVINGDDLLDELKEKIKKIIIAGENKNEVDIEETSEKIAVAACKFGFLKISREKDFSFDPDESVSIEGSSGPYLLYTYARCQSVLEKAIASINKDGNFNQDEIALIQELFKYEEKIVEAANKYNPSIIAEYLLSIARGYNEFYGKYRIIGQPEESHRLWLTLITANVLKSGLELLGIDTVEKM